MNRVEEALLAIARDLDDLHQRWALIGGLAVSIRVRPRTTRDVDVAVSVPGDRDAEALIRDLRARGYVLRETRENEATGRLAMASFAPAGEVPADLTIDLLFAFTGLEDEVTEAADRLDWAPGVDLPVAEVGHLLALKTFSASDARIRDYDDLQALIRKASSDDLELARAALARIADVGNAGPQDFETKFEELVQRLGPG